MITLLSDFGLQDASIAIAKGVLLQHAPGLPVVDISHEVMPFQQAQAAYLLASAYANFPAGTCHVILFDVFTAPVTRLLISEHNGHYFLSSDNGLLPIALGAAPAPAQSWIWMELQPGDTFSAWLHEAGHIIALLQHQPPASLALPAYTLKATPKALTPVTDAEGVQCQAIHIDNFENVVLNISRQQFTALGNGRPFRLQFMEIEEIDELSENYNDVREGYKLCRFNNNGYLEIAINHGRAASLFGLRLGGKLNNIKILFE
jgi:S-adenosylmethionine hydrolase